MARTLKQWETYLSKQMPRVHLLAELGLNYEDMLEIASLVKKEITKWGVGQTTKSLEKEFPSAFVALLAAFAAQNTEYTFWETLASLIGTTGGSLGNANWRSLFITILRKKRKETFEDVGGATNKYVTSIRIHGGIPSYSLRDYFSNMLLPSIEYQEYAELSGEELLNALLNRSSVQMFTDSTVRNFFENSGEIGLAYLEACRNIARAHKSGKQVPVLHGLPDYVVQKLINFLEYREDEAKGLRRPRIKFNPEGDGLVLELPEEPISGADVRGSEVRWRVRQDQKILREISSSIVRSGRDIVTEEQTIPLGYLLEPFKVSFSIPNQNDGLTQIREWSFEIRSQDAPDLLVFRADDGSLLRWSQTLPAQDLLLVYPNSIKLKFEGEPRLIHTSDIYAEGWSKWEAEYHSLADVDELSLVKRGETIVTIPIQKQIEMPYLVGDIFSPNLDAKDLYLGTPPRLRIPLRSNIAPDVEVKRWRIELNSAWETDPPVRLDFKLIDKIRLVLFDEEKSEFEVKLGSLLGKEPKGTYTLRVRGPRETDVEISFRVWPTLQIKDLPEFILPTDNQNVTLQFTLPAQASLETQAGATGINITGKNKQFAVDLDETVSQLDLNLTWRQGSTVVHVPFSLPIPRIKWRLVMGEDSKVAWSNRSIRKPIDAFLQSNQTAALLVQMPRMEDQVNLLVLRMIDPENPKVPLKEFPVQPSVLGSDHVRFLLNAQDTINDHRDPSIFEFQLLLVNNKGLYQPITLLLLTREVDVSNVRIEETTNSLFLLWNEPSPLRNRRVFIRSLWKVWVDAWNIKIPDGATGKFDLLSAGFGLPPSCYEIHFYVAPSWEPNITSAPDHSTFIVNTISPEHQIEWLDGNLRTHPEQSYTNHLERACLYSTIGDLEKQKQEIQFCFDHIDQANLLDLFAFHRWLENIDPNTRRAIQMKMYKPEFLKQLFTEYKASSDFRRKYLNRVTSTHVWPESALLLIENENEPVIVFHALRELVMKKDERLIEVLALMLEDGRISDEDAVGLLRADNDREYYISQLDVDDPGKVNLRLLSGLVSDRDDLLELLSDEKILDLAKSEIKLTVIKKYTGILIERGYQPIFEFIMELFKKGKLLNKEVTELLENNTKFSVKILSALQNIDAHTDQLTELTRRHPIEAGNISVGMYVKTPAGWGRIEKIQTPQGGETDLVSLGSKNVKYNITLYEKTIYPINALLDVEAEKLIFPGNKQYYQCGNCSFVCNNQEYLLRVHTREKHPGIGTAIKILNPPMRILSELQFSESLPE